MRAHPRRARARPARMCRLAAANGARAEPCSHGRKGAEPMGCTLLHYGPQTIMTLNFLRAAHPVHAERARNCAGLGNLSPLLSLVFRHYHPRAAVAPLTEARRGRRTVWS